jgi:hypothetical protein
VLGRQAGQADLAGRHALEQAERDQVGDHHVGRAPIELEPLAQHGGVERAGFVHDGEEVELRDGDDQQVRSVDAVAQAIQRRRVGQGHARNLITTVR